MNGLNFECFGHEGSQQSRSPLRMSFEHGHNAERELINGVEPSIDGSRGCTHQIPINPNYKNDESINFTQL